MKWIRLAFCLESQFAVLSFRNIWMTWPVIGPQISIFMQEHLQTSWEKTRHSHVPLARHLISTTYAQTFLKTTGSMVWFHTFAYINPAVIPFPPASLLTQRTSVCPRDAYWHSSGDETTHSFSWNFYMNATAEQQPHLQGKFIVSHKVHSLCHTICRATQQSSLRREFTTSLQHFLVTGLSPASKSLHMVSTFHSHTVRDVWSYYVFLSPARCVNSMGWSRARRGKERIYSRCVSVTVNL